MDEYVIVEKSSLKSMADTIRDTLGSTNSIAVTDLGAKLIESIQAGEGGVTSITGTVTITGSLAKFKLFNYDELTSIFGDPLPTLLILFYSNNSKRGDHTSLILWISDQSDARYCYKAIANGSNAGNTSTVSTTLPTLNKSGLYLNRYSSHYIFADEYKYCIARFE